MKQLAFDFTMKNPNIPSFETWYSENSKERRQWKEKPYSVEEGKRVYQKLVKQNFFK